MSSHTVVLVVIAAGVTTASVIDIATRRVPNALTLLLAATGVALAVVGVGAVSWQAALLGGLLGGALMLPAYLFGATGGGDLKLLAAVSTLLGPSGALMAFVYTCISGAVIAAVVAVLRRRLSATVAGVTQIVASGGEAAAAIEQAGPVNRFAYAPAIAVGVMLVALGY